jgi:ribosomal protein L12E/L44/L45/RPP1/RPP2
MKRIALLSLVALACGATTAVARQTARHTVATAPYDPRERDAAWARALDAFQSRGVLVAASDREGGVLTSQQQPAEVPCDEGSCRAIVAQQLTLTSRGIATLRTHRSVTTEAVAVAPAIAARDQQETNDLLAAITGSPATAFVPPAPPAPRPAPAPAPAAKPAQEARPSAPCKTYQDCPPGSICTEGACRP